LSILIVHWSKGTESFLACRIPNFEFDRRIANMRLAGLMTGHNGRGLIGSEIVGFRRRPNNARFANSGVAKKDNFHAAIGHL
jgi:hypothetical protein